MMERQKYTVVDQTRSIIFTGTLLGHSSSAEEKKNRWTEMNIYLTDAGQYIVAGTGHSTVKKGDWVRDAHTGRTVQAPEDETPRPWFHVCSTAEGTISVLHMKDSEGVRYMTNVAKAALEAAILQDRSLAEAFSVERIA